MASQDIYLQAEGILSDNEKNAFLKRFVDMNPHWNGAHVADILSELHNTDAHCGELEDLHERISGDDSKYISVAGLLCIYVNGEISDEDVKGFARRLKNKHG